MKAAFLLSGTLTLLGVVDMAAPRSRDTVLLLDRQLHLLATKHNSHAASRLFADDFLLVTSTGQCKRKGDMLKEMDSPATVLQRSETLGAQVRLLGSTAVLTGTLHQQGTRHGQPFDTQQLVTYTWVRNDGNWQLLGAHSSPLAQ